MSLAHRGTYPDNWPEIAAAVKSAAGDRCIRCGHPSGDRRVNAAEWLMGEGNESGKQLAACTALCSHPRDGKMRVLTVHHLDGDKGNCKWWNLLALCQICHLKIQGRVDPEIPWIFEHSEWFKPFVAGFYAHYYGNLNLSREEIERDLPRFLSMGQPWTIEFLHPSAGEAK